MTSTCGSAANSDPMALAQPTSTLTSSSVNAMTSSGREDRTVASPVQTRPRFHDIPHARIAGRDQIRAGIARRIVDDDDVEATLGIVERFNRRETIREPADPVSRADGHRQIGNTRSRPREHSVETHQAVGALRPAVPGWHPPRPVSPLRGG